MTKGEDLYDPEYVKGVFDRCSGKYIGFSYFMSFGFTERWRRQCVALIARAPGPGATGYDLMAGTGEAWPHLFRRFRNLGSITAIDISSGMHERALKRLHMNREFEVSFIQDDVLQSQLPPQSADFLISTFGLKTFNGEQLEKLADLIAHVLKPGGQFALIEASDPKGWWLRPLYLFHLRRVLPLIERVFLRGAQDFAHIGQYSVRFGDASDFGGMLKQRGLEVRFKRHFFGCATSVSGHKP